MPILLKRSIWLVLPLIVLPLIFSYFIPDLLANSPSSFKGVGVYAPIPGITPSTRFAARVSDGRNWRELFTMETVGPKRESSGIYAQGVYESVTGHSASWCTFEMDVPVTVEIKKLSPGEIRQCIVRPLSLGINPIIAQDKHSVNFEIKPRIAEGRHVPVNIAVEINGQTEEMMTVFASPHLEGKPNPDDPGVFKVLPGTPPPSDGDWQTLYFMPGVHDLGRGALPLQSGKNYYIPGDAWVDGAMGMPRVRADGAHIFGLGVLSGRKLGWKEVKNGDRGGRPIELLGKNTVLEGITIINSPLHTIMAGSDDSDQPTVIRNVKMHNWRVNTDGIHFFGSGIAEDCFIHSQDDSHYVAGGAAMVRFRRMVYWRDKTFGVDIILTAIGGQREPNNSVTEDCDSIYNKSVYGGVHIDNRGLETSHWIDGVIVRDLRIEDPCKNKPLIHFVLTSEPSSLKNVQLKNITVLSDNGHPFELYGAGPQALIEDITFEDIKVGNRYIDDFSSKNFRLAFVRNLKIVRNGKVVATYSSDIEGEAKAYHPEPNNLLVNPGFELRELGWRGGQVPESAISAHQGNFVMEAVSQFDSKKMIRQDLAEQVSLQHGIEPWNDRKLGPNVPGKLPNIPYLLTAWMKTDGRAAIGEVGFQFTLVSPGAGDGKLDQTVTAPAVSLTPGKWVKVSGVVRLPWDYEKHSYLRKCFFFAKAAGNFQHLYFDDCSVVPLAPEASEVPETEAAHRK